MTDFEKLHQLIMGNRPIRWTMTFDSDGDIILYMSKGFEGPPEIYKGTLPQIIEAVEGYLKGEKNGS